MRAAAAVSLALCSAACGGCGGDDGVTPDGPRPDAMIDATVGCTGPQDFTGELIDFDSSPTAFLGVFDAQFTLRGEPGCTATTAPNGRFVMTLPETDAIVDVDGPTTYLDGLVVVPRATITAPMAVFSLRGITDARAISLSEDLGETYDVARATVMVYQAVDAAAVTLTGGNGETATSLDGTMWQQGNDSKYIVFTNVDVSGGTQTLSATAGIGSGPIPVEAGKVTYVTTLFALD